MGRKVAKIGANWRILYIFWTNSRFVKLPEIFADFVTNAFS